MKDSTIWMLLCLGLGTVILFLAAGRIHTDPQRRRPNFRTRLDLDLMDTLLSARRYEEGARVCREILDRYPGDHEAHCYLATCLMYMGEEDEARAELMPLAACARPKDPWVFSQLGYLFSSDGQYGLARWALDRGLELFPHDVELLTSRSRYSLEDGEAVRALGYAQQALLEDPEDQNALWAKVTALEALESYDEAEQELEKVNPLSSDDYEPALEKAHIALLRGDTEAALDICERELLRFPRSGALYLARSAVMTRAGRYDEALAQIERAGELGESEEALQWASLEPLCGAGRREEAYEILDGLIRAESPLLEHMKSEWMRKDYPLLTGQADFLDFLERKNRTKYN